MKSLKGIIVFVLCAINICNAQGVSNIAPETDTDGNAINAHGAGILVHEGWYYLFGEIKKGTTWMVPDQGWECYRVPAGGVSCYASKNLKNWEYKGVSLSSTVGDPASDLDTSRVIERPKVLYNSITKKFVMWFHADNNVYRYARCGIAVSDRPEGPYQYKGSYRPFNKESRDMTVYKDDDGTAYLVFTTDNNTAVQVAKLSADYLSVDTTVAPAVIREPREAPAMFKHNGKYYIITSGITGWSPNAASYATADKPLGKWTTMGSPCVGDSAEVTFNAQSTFVLPLGNGRFLFMADKWNKSNLQASGYLWLPFMLENGVPVIRNR